MEENAMGMQEMLRLVAQDFHHAAAEIRRIGSIGGIAREAPSAVTMFLDSLFINHQLPESTAEGPHLIFMPGFFTVFEYYLRLGAYLRAHGVELVIPRKLKRNTLGWEDAHRVLSDAIKADEDATGKAPALAGHSKGGTDIFGVLPDHPEIDTAIFIGSPLRGASLRALNLYLSLTSGRHEHPFDPATLEDQTFLRKITVITSDRDQVVPTHEAELAGAQRTIKTEEHAGFDLWHCHTGLAYRMRREITTIVNQREHS